MENLFVNIGEIKTLKGKGILSVIGLGSCVGVALYDPVVKAGGLAHIFLAKSKPNGKPFAPGKFADTGIIALIQAVTAIGGNRRRFVAKLAGGANVFANFNPTSFDVGKNNILAVKRHLRTENVRVVGEDLAGNHGRKMSFYVDTGLVIVSSLGKKLIEI